MFSVKKQNVGRTVLRYNKQSQHTFQNDSNENLIWFKHGQMRFGNLYPIFHLFTCHPYVSPSILLPLCLTLTKGAIKCCLTLQWFSDQKGYDSCLKCSCGDSGPVVGISETKYLHFLVWNMIILLHYEWIKCQHTRFLPFEKALVITIRFCYLIL